MTHFWHFFYAPHGQPWYTGGVWGNVIAVSILAPGAYLWSRTKYWPLNLIHRKLDAVTSHVAQTHELAARTHEMTEEMHHLAHHGEPHPRVVERQRRTP